MCEDSLANQADDAADEDSGADKKADLPVLTSRELVLELRAASAQSLRLPTCSSVSPACNSSEVVRRRFICVRERIP